MTIMQEARARDMAQAIQRAYTQKALVYLANRDLVALKRLVETWHADTLVSALAGKGE